MTGHNESTSLYRKPGYHYQMEVVFRALKCGWSKELIGEHIIRNNEIYDCGQTGIVGHLGCINSEIRDNHIHHIAIRHEWYGYEIAGIKFHAAIDTRIIHNRIDHCALGTWLDWEAQGTRVSDNLYYENERDFMIEVTHGPCVIDHNIFGSAYSLDNAAQGSAFVHNLFAGMICQGVIMDRMTPYHLPHSTEVAGVSPVYGGDDRFIQNIFIGGKEMYQGLSGGVTTTGYGTGIYNGAPTSIEEYIERVRALGNEDHSMFNEVKQPVYVEGNVYDMEENAFECEQEAHILKSGILCNIEECGKEVYLNLTLPENIDFAKNHWVTTEELGRTRISDCIFDESDGKMITFDTDMLGNIHEEIPCAGPIDRIREGYQHIKLWNTK